MDFYLQKKNGNRTTLSARAALGNHQLQGPIAARLRETPKAQPANLGIPRNPPSHFFTSARPSTNCEYILITVLEGMR